MGAETTAMSESLGDKNSNQSNCSRTKYKMYVLLKVALPSAESAKCPQVAIEEKLAGRKKLEL